jgi:xanthine permease XanP
LSALFRIGNHTRRRRAFDARHSSINDIAEFLERQGKSWGARVDVVRRAEFATWQAFEILTEHALVDLTGEGSGDGAGTIELETIFDEFNFTVVLHYHGILASLAMHPPTHEEFLASEEAVMQMAGYLLRRLADRVDLRSTGAACEMRLSFTD